MKAEDCGFTSDNTPLSLPICLSIGGASDGFFAINCRQGPCVGLQSIADDRSTAPSSHLVAAYAGTADVRYVQASLAEATTRAYRQDVSAFMAWGGTFPAPAAMVARYLAERADCLSPPTLQRRTLAIGKLHRAQGHPDPTKDEHVRATLRGIRRIHGRPSKQAAPLLREDLLALIDALPESLQGVRDRALLLIGFAGGFRRSEIVGLRVEDVTFVTEGLLITLRRSKTDQEGRGRLIGIPWGRTRACPVKALRAWLSHSAIANGPIFKPVHKGGVLGHQALTGQSVTLILRNAAARIGLPSERLSGHSLRAGFVTSAAKAGVSSWRIRRQTGHQSDAMVQRYIRDTELFVDNAVAALL